jgi:diguanylate cyclase (GGDEF)-like protein
MLFSFLIGVYTLANSDLLGLFNMDLSGKCMFEYLSLYTFTIPFTVYFSDWTMEKGFPKALRLFFNIWIVAELFFVALVCLLHFTNVAHMPEFVTSSHVFMLVTMALIIVLTVTRMKVNHRIDKGLAVGFALAIGVAAVELVRYNVEKFITGFKDNKYSSSIGIAALIVVITLFVDFMSKIAGNLRKEAEARAFEKMAYMDELTGVLNRRGIEEPMNALKSAKKLYAIISIDMNLLKMMNDTYGHATGDRALSLLAKKLCEAFPEPCSVARVGGDEFVVAIPNTTKEWVEKHRDMFEDKLSEYNMRGENVTLSAACGIAYSDEADAPEKVFGIADDRMYRSKKESKMGRE